jgi:hypothetical protein
MAGHMTQDEIIEMARESGLETQDGFSESVFYFAKLVAEKEREACAVIAETPISGEQDDITMEAKDRVAKTIRARGQAC